VPFAYYDRLSPADRAVYRRSDAVSALELRRPDELRAAVGRLRDSLAADDRSAVEHAARELAAGIVAQLGAPPVRVGVLAIRPRIRGGELHGIYLREEGREPAVQVWMRTARHARVVAFRTFLRTLLHELLHHLDYEHLRLPDSFHTEGFFRRESSLVAQLLPDPEGVSGPRGGRSPRRTGAGT
jgi:hypothetical protein